MTGRLSLIGLAVVCLASAATAQTDGVATGAVRVDSPDATAFVTVDGSVAGRPGEVVQVAADRPVRVALVEPGAAWNPRRASVTVSVPAGDTLGVGLALPFRVRIESLPPGAAVALVTLTADSYDRRVLGTAPLTVDLPPGQGGSLEATLDGYRGDHIGVPYVSGELVLLRLAPDGVAANPPPVTLLTTERHDRRGALIDVTLGALTLAAGAAAVVTKFRADRLDDRYRDPASAERGVVGLRDEAQRLDRLSLVALGAMQLGVGAIAVRLILR